MKMFHILHPSRRRLREVRAIVEARHLGQDDAEERVERQARAFELHKPYLVERWNAAQQARAAADAGAGTDATAASATADAATSFRAGEAAG